MYVEQSLEKALNELKSKAQGAKKGALNPYTSCRECPKGRGK